MPNIEESITVQLKQVDTPNNNGDLLSKPLESESMIIVTDEDYPKRKVEDKLTDTNKTLRRDGLSDASKEVRSLLEFLFLDVKVRSPAEVSSPIHIHMLVNRVIFNFSFN